MRFAGDALCFDDILLTPGLSDVSSRSQVDLRMDTTDIHGGKSISLGLPVFAAPMDTVTGFDMVLAMGEAGGMGVLPRTENQKHTHKQLITGTLSNIFVSTLTSGAMDLRLCGGVTNVSMTRTRLTSIVKIPFTTTIFVRFATALAAHAASTTGLSPVTLKNTTKSIG